MDANLPKPPQPEQSTPELEKPKKEKKPLTEKQLEARKKGLAVMTERRKELAAKARDKKEEIKKVKKVVEEKMIKEDLGFVTRQDFESMKKELAELRALHTIAKERDAVVEKAKPERIVERIVEKHVPTPIPTQPSKLTGHALLDSIFFNK